MPAPVIGAIDTQQILINSEYRQTVQISNTPTAVEVIGMIRPFHYNWVAATNTLELLGAPEDLLSGTWTIQASNADGRAEDVEVDFAVIGARPVINTDDLSEVTIPRGQVFEKIVRIENASNVTVEGELIGLDHGDPEDETEGVRIFGTVPTDANFTIRSGVFTVTALYPLGDVTGELPWRFPGTVPSAPRQLTVNGAQGGNRVRLRWLAPLDNGGDEILRYEYSRDGGARRSTGGTSLEFFDTGLTNLDTHTYQVFAVNANGVSQGSNIVSVTVRVAITVPTVPRDFAVTPGNAEVTGTWTASMDDGGDEITDYEYQRDSGTWTSAGLTGTFTDTGLNNGQTYRYKMRAVNGQGNSVETAEVSVIPRTVPDAPTITATGGENEATVTITAPTDTGGLPILYYQYRIGSTNTWMDIPGGATVTSYTITGLDEGSTMIFVRAVTGIQAETERYGSAASNGVTVTVTGPMISGPTAPRRVRVRTGTFNIGSALWVYGTEWDAPESLGVSGTSTAPTLVRYEWRTSQSNSPWTSSGTSRFGPNPIRIQGGGNGSWIEVRAVNNNDAPNHLGTITRITWDGSSWTETVSVIAPVIAAIANVSRISGYAQFTIQASLSSGTTPTWSISGIAGATISQSGLITIPAGLSIATHTATVTATNTAGSDTEQFSVVVAAVGSAVAPVIAAISNVSRTSGYTQFTIQASLSSGTTPTWSISGIAGATISQSGLITIPAGLSVATHTATVTATNTAGSDTEQFSVAVAGVSANIRDGTVTRVGSVTRFRVNENDPQGFAIAPNGTGYMLGAGLNRLFTLNLTTGIATQVGSANQFGIGLNLARGGISIHPNGTAYMTEGTRLYTLNLSTGTATHLGSMIGFTGSIEGLAISPDGIVYVVTNVLYRLNLSTRVATQVGSAVKFGLSGVNILASGLGFAPDGVLYMTEQHTNILCTLNLTTGIATQVGSAVTFGLGRSANVVPDGFAIAPNGIAYMLDSATDALYRFNGA